MWSYFTEAETRVFYFLLSQQNSKKAISHVHLRCSLSVCLQFQLTGSKRWERFFSLSQTDSTEFWFWQLEACTRMSKLSWKNWLAWYVLLIWNCTNLNDKKSLKDIESNVSVSLPIEHLFIWGWNFYLTRSATSRQAEIRACFKGAPNLLI